MEIPIHKCPSCGSAMKKIEMHVKEYITVDLGSTGSSGVTVASNISGEVPLPKTPMTSRTRDYGSIYDSEIVILVPYECPNCGYKKSYRE